MLKITYIFKWRSENWILQRLASSEEILPIPDLIQATDVSMSEEVENSIRVSLEKVKYEYDKD